MPETMAMGAASRSGHGRGHDEDGQGADGVAGDGPGDTGDDQRERHEEDGVAVRHAHEGRLGGLGLLDQADDARVRAVLGRGGGQEVEGCTGVDGAGAHRIAGLAGGQARLARQRRFVEDGRVADDRAVDRDHLAGLDEQPVAHGDVRDLAVLDAAVAVAVDDAGRARDERGELPVGPAGRVALQPLPGREHDADDRRGQGLARAGAHRRWRARR